jgi:hypothetical protein
LSARERWRCLQHNRHVAEHRLESVKSTMESLPRNPSFPPREQGVDRGEYAARAHCTLATRVLGAGVNTALVRKRSNRWPGLRPEENMRPIDSFKYHALISLDLVLPFLPDPSAGMRYCVLEHAISEYKQAVSEPRGLAQSDTCYFMQMPLPGQLLSWSDTLASPECNLSAVLAAALITIESHFLTIAHELAT